VVTQVALTRVKMAVPMASNKSSTESIDTLVVGAGQAGLAMSEHLSNAGIEHLVFEKERIAERWRTARWDSLSANGPAWHDRFPTKEFEGMSGDAFPSKDEVVKYFEDFSKQINAPVKCGVEVTLAKKQNNQPGFHVETTAGHYHAMNIVVATGPFQTPVIPPIVPSTAAVTQMHSNEYKNPKQLEEGAVLVVGSGSSGGQIADELLRSGRDVYLSIGPHERPPRSYRGRDFVWWLGVLGKWDLATVDPATAHVTISVSGAHGGHSVDFREYAARGLNLLGMTDKFDNGSLSFVDDLSKNIEAGDKAYLAMLDEADAYIKRNGLDLPLEPSARHIGSDPQCVAEPIRQLHLNEAGISTIVWATGFTNDFSWLQVDAFESENSGGVSPAGKPKHQRGVSSEPGVYFLGLPWLSRRGSSFIWGVWHDAKYIADQIGIQRQYRDYR